MNRQRTLYSTLLTGLLLAGIPLVALARHNYIKAQDVRLELNSSISLPAGAENSHIWSEINMLNLSTLAGSDNFLRGQSVYVHMSKGPEKIAYPFAVTNDKPETTDTNIFAIKGKVSGRENDALFVRYNFESFLPSAKLKSYIRNNPNALSKTLLAVNDQGIARLVSVEISGKRFPYRDADSVALLGFTQ